MKNLSCVTVIILFLLNCGGEDATYTVEMIDGVRHVHNLTPLWSDEQKISLEFVRQIGELESEDENYQFYQPIDITVDR